MIYLPYNCSVVVRCFSDFLSDSPLQSYNTIRETYLIIIARINHWWEIITRHFTWHSQRQSHATHFIIICISRNRNSIKTRK